MNNKNQHWIPECYLKEWCDPKTPQGQTPYVWPFSKDGKSLKPRAPKKLCRKSNFYSTYGPDGSRDLTIENELGKLENFFTTLRDKKIKLNKPLYKGGYNQMLCME